MKILSVDDSKTMRQIIRNTVEVLGHDFLEAENGKRALDVLKTAGTVDMILLDWNMPEMDGITLLKTLKADPNYRDIPVTMVTTESERVRVIDAIKSGAKNYVTKPFTQEQLIAKIQESLGMGI
jgi:two-component system chemotaxis response regulator CheY